MHLERNKVVSEHQIRLDRPEQFQIQVGAAQFDKFTPITLRQLSCGVPVVADREFFHDWILRPQTEDGQIQGNKNVRHKYGHKDQNHRLDVAQQRRGLDVDVFIVKVGNVIQHFRKRSGLFADAHHFQGQCRESGPSSQGCPKATCLPEPDRSHSRWKTEITVFPDASRVTSSADSSGVPP